MPFDEERYGARLELQKLPRNANPTRLRNRCALTGRGRGTFRMFGLGRNKIREARLQGRHSRHGQGQLVTLRFFNQRAGDFS